MTTPTYFSLIIPCLNEEVALPKLLGDLDKQFWRDFELLVVDGHSDDQTASLTLAHPQAQLVNSTKRNVAHQRNLGAKQARGRYLLFLDADTRLPPSFLTGVAYQTQVYQPDCFSCWATVASDKKEDKLIATAINLGLELGKTVNNPVAIGAMMGIKRAAFRRLGGFDRKISYGEDTELFLRAERAGYDLKIFREPRFIFSLRRFERGGTLPMIRTYAKLVTKVVLRGFPTDNPDEYPMLGGDYYKIRHLGGGSFVEQLEKNLQMARTKMSLTTWKKFWKRFLIFSEK